MNEKRKGRITGSNVGAILGLSPHTTRADVMRRMCREWQDMPSEFEGNIATEYGTFSEKLALLDLKSRHHIYAKECGFIVDQELDWLGASPDGLIGDDAVLEIKCPYSLRDKKDGIFKTIAEQMHYYAQVQIEMFVTNRRKAYFYQWCKYHDVLEIVYCDYKWIDENVPLLSKFYDEYLIEREKPVEELRKNLSTKHTKKLVDEYDELSNAIDFSTARKKEILEELSTLSGNKNAEIWGHKLTKVTREGSISYAKVVKDHCKDVDLEPYKGSPTEYWMLRQTYIINC